MGDLTATQLFGVSCGGGERKDAITPTMKRPSSKG